MQRQGKDLLGQVFQIYMDGTLKGTVQTDENGEASYTVQRTLSSKGSSKDKTYVTNWNDLSKAQKKEATKNGWYDSKAKAYSVALQEAVKDAQNKIAAMKSASVHTWMTEKRNPHLDIIIITDGPEQGRTGWCQIVHLQLHERI